MWNNIRDWFERGWSWLKRILLAAVLISAVYWGGRFVLALSRPVVWHCCFTLALVFAVWAGYAWFTRPRYRTGGSRKNKVIREESTFNPVMLMRLMLGVAFVSILVLFWHIAMLEKGRNNWFTSIFAGVMNAGWMLSFGAPLFEVWDYIERAGLQLQAADRVWIAFVSGFSPLLTVSAAVTLFRVPKLWAMMFFGRREICIFSDLNERAQKYANAIRRTHSDQPPYIVFCSDGKVDLVDTANIAGPSLVLKQSICNLRLPRVALHRISFYLVTDDDNVIIEQTIRLHDKYQRKGCRINCVTPASLNEHVVDQLNYRIQKEDNKERKEKEARQEEKEARRQEKEKLRQERRDKWKKRLSRDSKEADKPDEKKDEAAKKPVGRKADASEPCIRFVNGQINRSNREYARMVQASFIDVINEAIRVVYHSLHISEEPLIDQRMLDCIMPESGTITLNALVLGAGSVGEEIARTLMWYCQLPDVRVQVTVAGKEKEEIIRGRVYRRNPRFEAYLAGIGYGEMAKLQIKPEIDLRSDKLESLLGEGNYHFVFVATGDDNQNYQLALRVRRYYLRNPQPWGCPDVRAVIWDDTVTRIIQQERIQALMGIAEGKGDPRTYTDYGLLLEGGGKSKYHPACGVTLMGAMEETLDTMHRLEYDALRYHAQYSNVSEEEMRTRGIPRKVYYEYYASSESDKRSNWAVAIHGRAKAEWYRWKNPQTDEDKEKLLSQLAENEHVRWCIFKLLEGDCPVPKEKLPDFLAGNAKGRDGDTIRGYHATLRQWGELGKKRDEARENKLVYGDKPREAYWDGMIASNVKLAKFSLDVNTRQE